MKYSLNFETKYDVGDIVVFSTDKINKNAWFTIGKITKVYHDCETFWYYIQVSDTEEFNYNHWGDISEDDIHFKITDQKTIDEFEKFINEQNAD